MGKFKYGTHPDLDSKWRRCQDGTSYVERILHIVERLRHMRQPINLGPSFVSFVHPYY